ncbi:MAG: signal peptide peptidase SppA, partial [Pseudomonadota bacterium]
MSSTQSNPFMSVLRFLWGAVNGVRRILHLILLISIFSIILIAVSPDTPVLPNKAALIISPSGALTEQLAGSPVDRAVDEATGNAVPQTLVRDVVDALDFAAEDDRIGAIYLRTEGISSASLPNLQRVADAILRFRASGKPVIAYGAYFSQQGYYLAAHADELVLDENGIVIADGYASYRNYYAEAIEKLSISWNVFKVGTHKSFIEPYTRNDMSDYDRAFRQRIIDGLWASYTAGVEQARELPTGTLQQFADNFDDLLAENGGDFATTSLANDLVDELGTSISVRERMIELVGTDEDNDTTFSQVGMQTYLASQRAFDVPPVDGDAIGVVVAVGSIVDGSAPPGSIGGDSTARLLRSARQDDDIKAVVLRVDSGGGSAFASDVILQEILALQAAGKPVIASMGGVAASGGYWISMATDTIVAEPDTITGSIGILSMLPTFERSLARLGVYTDGVGSTEIAGAMRVDRALTDKVKRV